MCTQWGHSTTEQGGHFSHFCTLHQYVDVAHVSTFTRMTQQLLSYLPAVTASVRYFNVCAFHVIKQIQLISFHAPRSKLSLSLALHLRFFCNFLKIRDAYQKTDDSTFRFACELLTKEIITHTRKRKSVASHYLPVITRVYCFPVFFFFRKKVKRFFIWLAPLIKRLFFNLGWIKLCDAFYFQIKCERQPVCYLNSAL